MKISLAAFALSTTFLMMTAGCSGEVADSGPEAPLAGDPDGEFGDEIKTKTDKSIQDEVRAAAEGTNYMSESDYPFTLVHASLPDGVREISESMVREKLAWYVDHDEAADKPLRSLYGMTGKWTEWKADFASCDEDPSEECEKNKNLMNVLSRNLRGKKIFYFGRAGSRGHVDGVGVSILVVGLTPKGNLVGVRTIAIWT